MVCFQIYLCYCKSMLTTCFINKLMRLSLPVIIWSLLRIIHDCMVHYCNSFRTIIRLQLKLGIPPLKGGPKKFWLLFQCIPQGHCQIKAPLHDSRLRAVLTNEKYLRFVLYAERHDVAALRSVFDMLRKSLEVSIKSMAKYQRLLMESTRIFLEHMQIFFNYML